MNTFTLTTTTALLLLVLSRTTSSAAANPPAFFLAGDSTTAVQSSGGGGWGNGFLSFLVSPAWGENLGHNGATTVSCVDGGDWDTVLGYVSDNRDEFDTYVTIQFGHNDQKPEKGISLEQFQTNLENLATEVKEAGATPVSLSLFALFLCGCGMNPWREGLEAQAPNTYLLTRHDS